MREDGQGLRNRGSGVLLHITSLPSDHGIGDLGPEAYAFVDFLAAAKQKYWQILPINPTDPVFDNSPYHSFSAFAANPLLISPDILEQEGFLDLQETGSFTVCPKDRVDFGTVILSKKTLWDFSYERFVQKGDLEDFEIFCEKMAGWLDDHALFLTLKSRFRQKAWSEWPPDIRDRRSGALEFYRSELRAEIKKEKFCQYLFFRQWKRLKGYCKGKGISVIGDIPIYVVHDSVDVWTHPELFKLERDRKPSAVAGVPPDYFSKTGQLWGNPLYRWDVLKQTGYDWWMKRLERNLDMFDVIRIDHFRGFVGYWEIPATEKTAVNGRWVSGEALDFFERLTQRFPALPIVAEDLGTITPDVDAIRKRFHIPGMKILLFAFGEDSPDHPYLPHTFEKNCVVYTGTHDNNTVKGWFRNEAREEDKNRVERYLGHRVLEQGVHWEFVEMGIKSAADTFIAPIQDILGLGEEARMNRPSTKKGNWQWRLTPGQLNSTVAERYARLTMSSSRA